MLFCAAQLLYCTKTVPGSREDLSPGAVLLRAGFESAGASPRAMGIILKALGAYNAFNLDGGGSSTFACLEGGVIKLVNNPSDGSERAVPNAIAICPREGDLSSTVEDMDVHNNVEL